jgi:hypothetical protein
MILFLVMFGMSKDGWRKWVYLLLALAALTFVFVANWQSGMGALESILAPVFTVGIGLKLEHLIGQSLTRREEVDKRYMDALTQFEVADQDATKHPEYMPLLRQEIWQRLVNLPSNKDYREMPAPFKAAAVRREMERDTWAYDLSPVTSDTAGITMSSNGHQEQPDFLALQPVYQNNPNKGM